MKQKGLRFKKPYFMLFMLLVAAIAFGANVWAAEVDYTEPTDGATGVPVSTNVGVTFYTDIDSITLNANTFFVTTGSGYNLKTVTGTISYSETVAIFSPATPLENNTTYKATVTTGVKDANGVPLATDYVWTFTTAGSSVSLISSTAPAGGSTGADVNTDVVVNFSQEMDTSTISGNTFYVAVGTAYSATTVAGSVSYADMKAVFTPNSDLGFNTTYTATVTSNVKDANGNSLGTDYTWTFKTKEQGGTPTYPEISSVNPPDGATEAPVNAPVAVTFSEPMNASTLEGAFSLKAGSGYGLSNVPVTMAYNPGNNTATFTPATALYNSTIYTAMVTTDAKSVAGYSVEADYSWAFTTAAEGGVVSPIITSVTPPDGADDVPFNTVIKAVFSKQMNPLTINPDTFYVGTGIGYDLQTIAGDVTYSGVTATFIPAVPLDFETDYSAVITSYAKDADGNSLKADFLWSFTTGVEGAIHPTVTSVDVHEDRLTITFSSEMDPSSVEESLMIKLVIPGIGYGIVAGTFSYEGTTATFMPYSEFIPGASYEVTITGATDTEGNHLKFDGFSYKGPENDIDNDNDGYTENQGDCNDANPDISPDADEILNDGIDQNCDGHDDAGFALEDFVTREALAARLEKLQEISVAHADTGYRLSGTPGYDAGLDYVRDELEAVGYVFTEQPVEFRFFEELEDPVFGQVAPNQVAYTLEDDFYTQTYSGSGDVTAEIAFVTPMFPPAVEANTSTDGCEAEDFEGIDLTGKIALIQRGDCAFTDKAQNAQNAGAVGVIIFNEGNEGDESRQGPIDGTLGNDSEVTIPVIDTSFQIGKDFYEMSQAGPVEVHMAVSTSDKTRVSNNLITETPGGNSDQVILVGAHIDGVSTAPAVNDNGSGTVAILELAYQIAQQGFNPANKVRFAWWAVEEQGTVGSDAYLESLSDEELGKIGMYLNFDMIGSDNYAIFVYDGNVSDTADDPATDDDMAEYVLRPESGSIEKVLVDYYDSVGLKAFPAVLDGRSDYDNFIYYGIPIGGSDSGGDGAKTQEQVDVYGGTAGVQYDVCYHKLCDDTENLNMDAMTSISKAAAHATQHFAQDVELFDNLPPAPRKADKKVERTKGRTFKYDRSHSDRHLYSVE
ncbi:MAG: M28 family peptidase [Desulfobacterales bacterium]|nr:M28 family peptidase [Desulfobacterales bacterium]